MNWFAVRSMFVTLAFVLTFVAPAFSAIPTVTSYTGSVVDVSGTVGDALTSERFKVFQPDGSSVVVVVVPGRTYVQSRDLLRSGEGVTVIGVLSFDANGTVVIADSVDPSHATAFDAHATHEARRNNSLRYFLGAAAGIVVGSGVIILRRAMQKGDPTGASGTAGAVNTASGTVSFGRP